VQRAKTGAKSLLGEGRYIKATLPPSLINALGMVVASPDPQDLQQAADAMAINNTTTSAPPRAVLLTALLLCPEGFTPPAPTSTNAAAAAAADDDDDEEDETAASSSSSSSTRRPALPTLPTFGANSSSSQLQQQGAGGGGKERYEHYGTVGGRWYAIVSLRLEDIILVTSRRRKQRLDSEAVLAAARAGGRGRGGASAVVMEAVEELLRCEREEAKGAVGGAGLEPLNFPKELKINDMAFVEEYGRCVRGALGCCCLFVDCCGGVFVWDGGVLLCVDPGGKGGEFIDTPP
jgi:hypothetical protein